MLSSLVALLSDHRLTWSVVVRASASLMATSVAALVAAVVAALPVEAMEAGVAALGLAAKAHHGAFFVGLVLRVSCI